MQLGFTVRVIDQNRYFEEMFKRSQDATRLFLRVGRLLVTASRNAFDQQSYAGKAWPTHRVPNVLGAVRDLEAGATVKESRFEGRPALIDTGELKRSIGWSLLGAKAVRVTATAPYAATQNNGGASSRAVSATVKANLSIFLNARPDRRGALGFLFRRGSVSARVPARPFLGITPLLQAQVSSATKDFILQRGEFRRV